MKAFFENKVVCITGSSQGIGKATALLLGSYGAKIVLNGRNKEKLNVAFEEVQAAGVDCFQVAGDVAKPEDCKHIIEAGVEHFGQLDVLINNAGIASRGRIEESSPENWESIFDINTLGSINTTYYALPHLEKQNGHVIIISSMAAKVGVPGHAGYSASKMALTAYAKALQIELKNRVHCGLVYVGFTSNESQKQILRPDGTYEALKERKGIRLAKREDVARSIAKAIAGRKKQVTLTLMGKMQHILLKFAPGFVYRLLGNSYKDYDNMYS